MRSAGRRDAHRRDAGQGADIRMYAGTVSNTWDNLARNLLLRFDIEKYFEAYKNKNPKKFEVLFKMYFSIPIFPNYLGKILFPSP